MRSAWAVNFSSARRRERQLSTAIVTAVNTTVAAIGPFRFGTSAMSHQNQGARLSAHIHHNTARGWRRPAAQNSASSTNICAGPHGQPPRQRASASGVNSSASQAMRQPSSGYRTLAGAAPFLLARAAAGSGSGYPVGKAQRQANRGKAAAGRPPLLPGPPAPGRTRVAASQHGEKALPPRRGQRGQRAPHNGHNAGLWLHGSSVGCESCAVVRPASAYPGMRLLAVGTELPPWSDPHCAP